MSFRSPSDLATTISHPHWSAVIVVAHAPTSQSSAETQTMKKFVGSRDCVLLIDANSSSGSRDGVSIGSIDDNDSPSTSHIRLLLQENALFLPSTFDSQTGWQPTWTSPKGDSTSRIDFVALSLRHRNSIQWTGAVPDIDLSMTDHDHCLAGILLEQKPFMQSAPCQGKVDIPCAQFDRSCIKGNARLTQAIHSGSIPPWDCDIESHVESFNRQCRTALQTSCPKAKSAPRKNYISDTTWKLRSTCRQIRSKLHAHRKLEAQNSLRLGWPSWKSRHPLLGCTKPWRTFALELRYTQEETSQ